jgi:plasmid stability protein
MKTPAKKKVRAVFKLDPDVRRALRLDAAYKERDMSDIVNETLRKALRVETQKQPA